MFRGSTGNGSFFGSFPAGVEPGEQTGDLRVALDQPAPQLRLTRAVEHAHWDDVVARGSPHAAKRTLAKPERTQRQMEFDRLTRQSFWRRAGLCALQSFMCQSFWVALILFVLCHESGIEPSDRLELSALPAAAARLEDWALGAAPPRSARRPEWQGSSPLPTVLLKCAWGCRPSRTKHQPTEAREPNSLCRAHRGYNGLVGGLAPHGLLPGTAIRQSARSGFTGGVSQLG